MFKCQEYIDREQMNDFLEMAIKEQNDKDFA